MVQYQYHPYILPLIASACVSLSLGIFTLRKRRGVKGAKSFFISMFVVTIWSAGNALEMAGADFATKLFWANIQYFAYCFSPVTLLALCMEFTGFDSWVANKKVLWFAVLPTVIVLLVWTDPLHGLVRYDMQLDTSGIFPVITKKYGPAFYIHAAYSHLLNLFAWALLIRAVFFSHTIYRKQAAALLLGVSMIIVPNILYISGLSPVQKFDLTPIFFAPAGFIIAWAIFRYKMFDVVPVAWATVIRTMEAGVMVLDLRNRVLDINPAFARMAGIHAADASSKPMEEVCAGLPELVFFCANPGGIPREFVKKENDQIRVYEAWLSPLADNKGNPIGRLAVVYDITQKKRTQQEYQKQQWKLAVTEERERLARDLHDNLAQVLGFIQYQTEGIRQELHNVGVSTAAAALDKLAEVTKAAHEDIRAYIRQARSTGAAAKNLAAALWKAAEAFEELTGIQVILDIPPDFVGQELDPQVFINLLYIIKEVLNNIRKHAQAGCVWLSLSAEEGQLRVLVEDDGKGFDVTQPKDAASGFGLGIMRERALEIGAQIEVESAIGKGSRITLWVPLEEGVTCREK
jgi:PAS domain S-box-containing protein